jgi:hypothetical protein
LADVCESPQTLLETLDIGALNLMCALGLPGAENIDPPRCQAWMDDAASWADFQTRRHWYRFANSPGTYRDSPGYFCCYHLLQVLQEEFRVRYNPARVRDPTFQDPRCIDPDFRDSRDLFIHGIIDGPGGTCASMPVLYAAIGRRLGYPLKLVHTRGHLFLRWEDPTGLRFYVPEVFNIEGAGEGIASYPDELYRSWPEPWTNADVAGGWYLKSLSREEELAAFLATRGECLTDNGRIDDAIQSYTWANGLAPRDGRYRSQLDRLLHQREAARINALVEWPETQRHNRERQLRDHSPAARTVEAPAHARTCQCHHCRHARAKEAPAPPHGDSCQCAACTRMRRIMQEPPRPAGHLPGCLCPHCRGSTWTMHRISNDAFRSYD